ncbi:MAG: metallophosphoesterase [Clostridia bacterium]|nr:metallophosphoesterase [Clostridia bacterium]
MNPIVKFLLWFLAAQAILTAIQFLLRKKTIKPVLRAVLIAAKALLAILFGVLVLAGPVQLRPVQPLMTALYIALFADAAADLLYSITLAIQGRDRSFGVFKTLSLVCGALFFFFGAWNMQTVRPNRHTYTSDKLTDEHTVVFLADLHVLDGAQPFSVTEKTIAEIKALSPDATILGGDIVDDYTTKEAMENTFRLFADFDTPVYYIYGNHDRQGHAEYAGGHKFTPEELEAAAAENGVIVLKDEFAAVAPDLLILGREDLSEAGRADISSLVNPSPESYLIVADHQPAKFKENLAVGTDLQLSGHTHAGQLFPLRMFYNLIGYCYGDYTEDGAVMYVSAGACGWRFPARTDARCQFEVITLRPVRER